MAVLRLGYGRKYKGIVIAEPPGPRLHDPPEKVVITCSNDDDMDRKNFPLTLELNREEAITLIEGICHAMKTPNYPPSSDVTS